MQGTFCRSESVFSHRQAATYSDSRQGEGNQSSHHHDEVQDVPHVSEVGAVVQNETLVDHLDDAKDTKHRDVIDTSGLSKIVVLRRGL